MLSLTTSRLNPSCLPPLNAKPGTNLLPVPGFHSIEVLTYPLMVVDESAVKTGLGFSSAWINDGRLTSPTAARPNVHLFTFITVPSVLFCFFLICRNKGDGLHFVCALLKTSTADASILATSPRGRAKTLSSGHAFLPEAQIC